MNSIPKYTIFIWFVLCSLLLEGISPTAYGSFQRQDVQKSADRQRQASDDKRHREQQFQLEHNAARRANENRQHEKKLQSQGESPPRAINPIDPFVRNPISNSVSEMMLKQSAALEKIRKAERAAKERRRIDRVEANRATERAAKERRRIDRVETNRAAERVAKERRRIIRGNPSR